MPLLEAVIGPLASIIDKVIPDKAARDKAKLELINLQGTQELETIKARLAAIVAEAQSPDPWTSRARPSFFYAMYVMILCALPMGVLAAFDPTAAQAIGAGITGYLNGLPSRSTRCSGPATSATPPRGSGARSRGASAEGLPACLAFDKFFNVKRLPFVRNFRAFTDEVRTRSCRSPPARRLRRQSPRGGRPAPPRCPGRGGRRPRRSRCQEGRGCRQARDPGQHRRRDHLRARARDGRGVRPAQRRRADRLIFRPSTIKSR